MPAEGGSVRKILLIILVVLIALAGILFSFRSAAATILWKGFHLDQYALATTADATLAMEIGDYYFGGGAYDIEKAQAAYQKALAINPTTPLANYQLARIFLVQSKFDDGLAAAKAELQNSPANKRTLYVRGLIYAYSKNFAASEADFKAFVAWAPTEWAGYNDLAWVLAKEGKYTEAAQVIKQGFERVPNGSRNPWLWNTLGVAELNLKQYTNAANSFQHAAEFAAILTEDAWRAAYPGNNSAASADGLEQFRRAIQVNLNNAKQGIIPN